MRSVRMYVLLIVISQTTCGAGRSNVRPTQLPAGIACLDWPMPDHRRISSKFMDPHHPFKPGEHSGIDFPAHVGTPVLAAATGKVTKIEPVAGNDGAGVYVRFAEGWVFLVYHLSRIDVAEGQAVLRGDQLGLTGGAVGAPGSGPYTTGPHLHFSLTHDDAYVDPVPFLCP